MSLRPLYAVLIDGGFVIKKHQQTTKRFPTADLRAHVDIVL